jgi:signal transduction histidine kinase
MSFWQQLNQLLSETPGNVVYHLVTLFAIQATLAISLSQWRRERQRQRRQGQSELARRLTLASLGLLIARFLLLVVSLAVAGNADATLPVRVLPPLEQAVNTVTVVLVAWALLPYFRSSPRLTDVAAVLVLLLAGVMYAFFAQDWALNAQPGMTYNASEQSTIWGGFQLLVVIVAVAVLLLQRFPGGGLRFLTLLALLAAHAVQFWDYPESVPNQTEIPFWIRLGHLVTLPMMSVVAYRHAIDRLLATQLRNRPAPEQMAQSLQWATRVIEATSAQQAMQEAADMILGMTGAAFVGVATVLPEDPGQLNLVSAREQAQGPRNWGLKVRDWPAFRMAMDQEEVVELLPEGVGARQVHDFYRELGLPAAGALLVVPLQVEGQRLGVLLLSGPPEGDRWPFEIRSIMPPLARYVARAVHLARRAQEARAAEGAPVRRVQVGEDHGPIEERASRVESPAAPPARPQQEAETVVSGRVIALEEERDRALEELKTLSSRLQRSEAQRKRAQERARDLADTVDQMEQTRPESEQVAALEAEVAALRESLIEAEEAMAMAAAAEGELSTEWVTTTISRYSGELEEAQRRIDALETELQERGSEEGNEVMTSLAQELRTPLTSIAGYTDLLLGETMGILGRRQRDFLQRVRANVERMGVLLDQIVQLASAQTPRATVGDVELVDVNEVVETAVSAVITQLRKKDLRLNLNIAEDLPRIPANHDALCQVLIHLLSNASQVSGPQGEMTVSAHADTMREVQRDGDVNLETFIHLSVKDSGSGIRPEDRTHVFDPQYRADNPLIGGLGDTGAGLAVAQTLVVAHGGRIWVESEMGQGSTFSVLLPLAENGRGPEDGPGAGPEGRLEGDG